MNEMDERKRPQPLEQLQRPNHASSSRGFKSTLAAAMVARLPDARVLDKDKVRHARFMRCEDVDSNPTSASRLRLLALWSAVNDGRSRLASSAARNPASVRGELLLSIWHDHHAVPLA